MSKHKLDHLGVSAFCESMAMMMKSGIQTDEAITLLQSGHESTGGVLEHGLSEMKQEIDQGSGLAAAMEKSGIFPQDKRPVIWKTFCFSFPGIMRIRKRSRRNCGTP